MFYVPETVYVLMTKIFTKSFIKTNLTCGCSSCSQGTPCRRRRPQRSGRAASSSARPSSSSERTESLHLAKRTTYRSQIINPCHGVGTYFTSLKSVVIPWYRYWYPILVSVLMCGSRIVPIPEKRVNWRSRNTCSCFLCIKFTLWLFRVFLFQSACSFVVFLFVL